MFARAQRKKRSHGSNFSSSVGDNSSVGGSSDAEGTEYMDGGGKPAHFNSKLSLYLSKIGDNNFDTTSLRTIRKAQSNSSLNPHSLASNTRSVSSISTLSPLGNFSDPISRRSVSGNHSTRYKQTIEKNSHHKSSTCTFRTVPSLPNNIQSGEGLGNLRFRPPAFPKNLAHMRSPFKNHTFLNSKSSSEELEKILGRSNPCPDSLQKSLVDLRFHILRHGLPHEDPNSEVQCSNSTRCRVWKALLGIYYISTGEYINLVAKGPSPMFEKVSNDTFRTLATDKKFLERVQEDMLVRVLNALVWKTQSLKDSLATTHSDYVQGMNVLVAPILYVMPEVDAFFSSYTLLKVYCPTYILPTLAGVHCGLKLLDRCLEVLDAELFYLLKSKNLNAEIYAFASVLTLSACTPPLNELLKVWDFLLAFGVHLNILCIVAQLMLMRSPLLTCPSPIKLLRTFPDLQAAPLLRLTCHLVTQLPPQLYQDLAAHTIDSSVCDRYLNEHRSDFQNNGLFNNQDTSCSTKKSANFSCPLVERKGWN